MMETSDIIIETIKSEFSKKNVLVLGDLMVDEYIVGSVSRISPEAPVPVLNFKNKSMKAGGACNVAANLRSLGANVFIAGIAAFDGVGIWLRDSLKKSGIETEGIVAENRPTIVKTRFATKNQQLLRMDNEITGVISDESAKNLLSYLEKNISNFNAVVLSDYSKGVLEDGNFVSAVIEICNKNGVFCSIDSKSRNLAPFKNADFVKPNNLELESAVGIKITDNESLDKAGKTYLEKSGARSLLVTRGADGISLFVPDEKRKDFPSKAVEVFDVTGAGDTVISTVTLAKISGLSIDESIRLANYAASVVISKVGTATVSQNELIKRINEEQDINA